MHKKCNYIQQNSRLQIIFWKLTGALDSSGIACSSELSTIWLKVTNCMKTSFAHTQIFVTSIQVSRTCSAATNCQTNIGQWAVHENTSWTGLNWKTFSNACQVYKYGHKSALNDHVYLRRILCFSWLFVIRKSHLPHSLGRLTTTGNAHASFSNRLMATDDNWWGRWKCEYSCCAWTPK
jgi:hypothetical protein